MSAAGHANYRPLRDDNRPPGSLREYLSSLGTREHEGLRPVRRRAAGQPTVSQEHIAPGAARQSKPSKEEGSTP